MDSPFPTVGFLRGGYQRYQTVTISEVFLSFELYKLLIRFLRKFPISSFEVNGILSGCQTLLESWQGMPTSNSPNQKSLSCFFFWGGGTDHMTFCLSVLVVIVTTGKEWRTGHFTS